MPRGVSKSIEERITEIDSKIADIKVKQADSNAKFKSKIDVLEAQKKELLDADRSAKLQKVLEVADEKGMSVDDILAKISQ